MAVDTEERKAQTGEKAEVIAASHKEEGETPSLLAARGPAVNPLLIFACATFAAASFLFGYDDKVISPIIALEPFVSPKPTALAVPPAED